MSLRIHEEDEKPFKSNPATIASHELPANCVQRNGVDVVGEEKTDLAPHLFNTNAASSDMVREKLDEERWNVVS